MSRRIFAECQRCGGSGSIETSQSEDGRFSYQDQCPECSSWGVVPISEPSEEMVEIAHKSLEESCDRFTPAPWKVRRALTAALQLEETP